MNHGYAVRTAICVFYLCAVASPAQQAYGASGQKPGRSHAAIGAGGSLDACQLLTRAEIEAVQGEPVKEAKPNVQSNGGMRISECLFHTSNFAKSVSVALAAPSLGKASGLTPRKFWQRQFRGLDAQRDKTRGASDEIDKPESKREEENGEARRIKGLGEDAYWVGSPIAGALYVLYGDKFVRISVGGVGEESVRIEKSKVLARAALKRL
jgi:hypothetical protein